MLEVKKIDGLGTTIDVCLVNGELKDTDTIVLATSNGPVVTQVKTLLTQGAMKEMRVKNEYTRHKAIKGCMGVKLTAIGDLDHVVAGTNVYLLANGDNEEELKLAVMEDVKDQLSDISTEAVGVFVQASTLGSLEALMSYLKSCKIPVSNVGLGTVHKKDVTRASAMLEHEKEFATILAFDVKVDQEAIDMAKDMGIEIFTADVIYHLTDKFSAYQTKIKEERKKEALSVAVFPCRMKIIKVFRNKNPIVLGVDVTRGWVMMLFMVFFK